LAVKHGTFAGISLAALSLPEAADGVAMGWSCGRDVSSLGEWGGRFLTGSRIPRRGYGLS